MHCGTHGSYLVHINQLCRGDTLGWCRFGTRCRICRRLRASQHRHGLWQGRAELSSWASSISSACSPRSRSTLSFAAGRSPPGRPPSRPLRRCSTAATGTRPLRLGWRRQEEDLQHQEERRRKNGDRTFPQDIHPFGGVCSGVGGSAMACQAPFDKREAAVLSSTEVVTRHKRERSSFSRPTTRASERTRGNTNRRVHIIQACANNLAIR